MVGQERETYLIASIGHDACNVISRCKKINCSIIIEKSALLFSIVQALTVIASETQARKLLPASSLPFPAATTTWTPMLINCIGEIFGQLATQKIGLSDSLLEHHSQLEG